MLLSFIVAININYLSKFDATLVRNTLLLMNIVMFNFMYRFICPFWILIRITNNFPDFFDNNFKINAEQSQFYVIPPSIVPRKDESFEVSKKTPKTNFIFVKEYDPVKNI